MGSKGSQKTESTSTATSAPNAQAGALYGDILNQLQGYVQQNPNAPTYQGQQVAQFTPDQLAAMNTVNQAQGAYKPYLQQAGQFAQQAGSAITPGQISDAMNPYQQQVIDTTMAQMGQKNAQQMSSLKGTEAQQGAFGGSRAAVTEATLGGQQNMNAASTLAGLNSQNYSQAVAQAQGNRAAAGTGAQLESGLGTQSMQLPMYGAQQQLQTGAQQQQLAQQNLNVPYQQWLQQQSWTPQMLQFEAGLGTGVGSQMGGTSTNAGTTTNTPAQASPWMQAAGMGLSAAMMFSDKRAKENIEPVGHLNDGQKIYKYNYKGDPHTQIGLIAQEVERKHPEAVGESNGLKTVNYDLATRNAVHKADGGSVGSDIVGNAVRMARQMREGMAGGGVPGAGVGTAEYMGHKIPAIIPTSQMAMGKGAPSTPGFVSSPEMKDPNAGLMKGLGSGLGTLAKAGYDKWNEPMDISTPAQGAYTPMAVGDISSGTIGGTGLLGSGGVYSLGGTVSPESAYHGFAHRAYGGDVVFDPTPISEQGGEDPNKAPVMPAEGFTDQPPSIVPAGEFKPYEAPPQADVPMPRPRPERLRVDDLAAAPMPIGADAVPIPRPRPAQTAAQPTDDIFPRVLQTESTGRQLDKNGNPLTSPKGATGIAQIMPTTGPEAAKLAGLPWDEQKFKYDANYNAALGKAYFDHQTNVFGGDPEKGAAAYNAGPGRLREAMAMAAANGGSYKDYLPAETQNYLGKIFGQQQAGVGPRGDEGGQALAFNRESSIAGSQGIGTIDALRAQKDGGANAPLPFTQGEGGDRTSPAIDAAAQAIVPKNDDPRKLPQNLSILERVLGKEFDPATRQAIMAAGLRMMTTPGNIGTVLGTAGMQGMATYSEAKQMEQKQAVEHAQVRKELEQERHNRAIETMKTQTEARQLLQPVKIGSDLYGDIFAIRDPQTGSYHRIDPATGAISRESAATPNEIKTTNDGGSPSPGTVMHPRDADSSLVGEDYIKQFKPELQAAARAMIEGRQTPTGNQRLPINQYAKMIAQKYGDDIGEPIDDTTFTARRTFRNQMASGSAASVGGQTNAVNTSIGHLSEASKLAKELNNQDWYLSFLTDPINKSRGLTTEQAAKVNTYKRAVQLYAAEVQKYYAGSTGGVEERKAAEERLGPYMAPKGYANVFENEMSFITSKAHALEAQRDQVMGKSGKTIPIIRPEAQKYINNLNQNIKELRSGSPAAPPAAEATLPPNIPTGSKLIGTSTDGKKVYEAPNGKRYTSE